MIVVKLIGGLGNQMFQYATARALALRHNKMLVLDCRAFESYTLHRYGLGHFAFEPFIFPEHYNWKKKLQSIWNPNRHYQEDGFAYNKAVEALSGNVIFLSGYFQSERYFEQYADTIRADFKINTPLRPVAVSMANQIFSTQAVSVHFRRGDYVGNSLHQTDNASYYEKAVAYMESRFPDLVFYVFSDDISWARNHFKPKSKVVFIDFTDATTNYEDLFLMSSCRHHIIANSSFSWWGAWLNPNPGKLVIAPKQWFNDNSINVDDLIPQDWVKI